MTKRKPEQLTGADRAEYQRILEARNECERFIQRAKVMQMVLLSDDTFKWARKERADMMRSSMDATRALAKLRNPRGNGG